MGTPPQEGSPPQHPMAQYSLHEQPHMQHIGHRSTPSASASPPMQNGAFPPHRLSTPQPHPGSRPTSRNHVRRQSSNLVPHNHPHPQATQPMHQHPQYMYQQQQTQQYNQQHAAYMRATQGTPPMHGSPMPPQHHYSHPGPPNAQMQQLYLQEQRRQSMPPQMPVHTQQEVHRPMMMHTPPQPSRPFQSHQTPPPIQTPQPWERAPSTSSSHATPR